MVYCVGNFVEILKEILRSQVTATVTHGQVSASEQFFLELQKKLSDYYINFETNITFDKIIFFSSIS